MPEAKFVMQRIPSLVFCISLLVLAVPRFGFSQPGSSDQNMSLKEVHTLIDSISSVLNRLYIFPEAATKISGKLKSNYRNGAYNKRSRTELAAQISDDIQKTYKDPHLKIGYFPDMVKSIEEVKTASDEKRQRDFRMARALENHFGFIKKEVLPGNIGYIRWDYFDEFVEEGLPVFDSCFRKLSACSYLILDLRENQGGNSRMVGPLQNYFFDKRTPMNHIIDRSHDTLKHFTDSRKTKFKLTMPVYILISNRTFSAGEDFTYGLQQARRAIVVGDTSGGGAHPTNDCSIGQGFIMAIPTKRAYNEFSKTDWEVTGILPDEPVESGNALEEALLIMYTKSLARAKTAAEKKNFQTYINDIKSGKYQRIPFSDLRNNDATNAIEIRDSIYGPTNVCKGFGAVREYHEKTSLLDHGAPVYINEENSAWFKLKFDRDTILTFDIVPVDPTNDYDFIFFKCQSDNCIETIKTGKNLPDRTCHSGFSSFNGSTGLSHYSSSTQVSIGPGPTYVRAMPVKAGETYYLMVTFAERQLREEVNSYGFTIYFHDYWPKKKPIALNNVNFDSNSAALMEESYPDLDKLAGLLKKDKSINIEIRGHADDQGIEEKNIELSLNRSQAVKDYLVSRSADAKRISCKGFGSSKPMADNSSESGRKKNRRVEFAIIMR